MRIRFPCWDRIEDKAMREWVSGLPEDQQVRLAGMPIHMVDRAYGDFFMAECIAAPEPWLPTPDGWEEMSDADQCLWYNEVLVPASQARAAELREG